MHLFLSSDERREKPTLLGSLERHNINHWYCFRNVLLSIYLEFRMIDKVLKSYSDGEYVYTAIVLLAPQQHR
jgi:hypothetical protein